MRDELNRMKNLWNSYYEYYSVVIAYHANLEIQFHLNKIAKWKEDKWIVWCANSIQFSLLLDSNHSKCSMKYQKFGHSNTFLQIEGEKMFFFLDGRKRADQGDPIIVCLHKLLFWMTRKFSCRLTIQKNIEWIT